MGGARLWAIPQRGACNPADLPGRGRQAGAAWLPVWLNGLNGCWANS